MNPPNCPDDIQNDAVNPAGRASPANEAAECAEAVAQARIHQLEEDLQAAENRFLRAVADFDNYRKRQAAAARELGREETRQLILDLLEVWDNFQRAIEQTDGQPAGEFQTGIQSIFRLLGSIMEKHGVTKIDTAGQKFDPNFHEVLDVVPADGRPDMFITRLYKDGFLFHGKLLRPALVQIARQEDNTDGSQ